MVAGRPHNQSLSKRRYSTRAVAPPVPYRLPILRAAELFVSQIPRLWSLRNLGPAADIERDDRVRRHRRSASRLRRLRYCLDCPACCHGSSPCRRFLAHLVSRRLGACLTWIALVGTVPMFGWQSLETKDTSAMSLIGLTPQVDSPTPNVFCVQFPHPEPKTDIREAYPLGERLRQRRMFGRRQGRARMLGLSSAGAQYRRDPGPPPIRQFHRHPPATGLYGRPIARISVRMRRLHPRRTHCPCGRGSCPRSVHS
jgi:hypothetical protein